MLLKPVQLPRQDSVKPKSSLFVAHILRDLILQRFSIIVQLYYSMELESFSCIRDCNIVLQITTFVYNISRSAKVKNISKTKYDVLSCDSSSLFLYNSERLKAGTLLLKLNAVPLVVFSQSFCHELILTYTHAALNYELRAFLHKSTNKLTTIVLSGPDSILQQFLSSWLHRTSINLSHLIF